MGGGGLVQAAALFLGLHRRCAAAPAISMPTASSFAWPCLSSLPRWLCVWTWLTLQVFQAVSWDAEA